MSAATTVERASVAWRQGAILEFQIRLNLAIVSRKEGPLAISAGANPVQSDVCLDLFLSFTCWLRSRLASASEVPASDAVARVLWRQLNDGR